MLACDMAVAASDARFGLPEVKRSLFPAGGVFLSRRIPTAIALKLMLTGDTANGPLAVTAIKRLVRAAASQPPAEVWALQAELHPGVFGSADAREGAAAFIEKRVPVWQSR